MNPASTSRLRRWLIVLVLALVGLPVGYYVARHHAWPAYKAWREAKLERMTEEFMAKGDYDNALLTARQALRKNQRNVAHWRLAAAAAKAKGSTDVIYYQRNVAQLDHRLDSQLELIRLALKFGAYRDAIDAIENVNAEGKQNVEFHRLAAQAYLNLGRPLSAKVHLNSLISLQPDDKKARLDLAEIQLGEDPEGKNRSVRQEIVTLSQSPDLRVRAMDMLLKDAIVREDKTRARELAEQLRKEPGLENEQRVLVLSGLTAGDSDDAEEYRHTLQKELSDDPAAVVALTNYYRRSGPAIEARKWFDSLAPAVRKDPRVQEAIAAAFLEWKEWTRLDQALANGQWKDREFMRHAFTAYSARKTGRMADAGNAWRLAVIQAGDSTRATSELLALVARWGWQTEQYDLVWKLFALMPRNESISRQLIAWEYQQGHTANLNRIYARLLEFSGDDRMLKNNFAYSSLLLDANLSKAYEVARQNYQDEPENPYYVTTQALAMYKQNRPAAALNLLETLRPSALSTPERTLFRALFRAGSGDASGAADLLDGVKVTGFLPEERRLAAKAASEVARLDRERGESLRLHALDTNGEIDRNKGWLKILPTVTEPTLEMQTANSLYAMGDLRGLGAQLRKRGWENHEHLRLALIAYVSRGRGDQGGARSYWRTALGTAVGDLTKLRQLEDLATSWQWRTEQMAVISKIFEIDPSNQEAFSELMSYNRAEGRTAELVSVLSAYLSAHPGDQDQRCGLAYYSMLSGLNVARAYVTAQESYRDAPTDPNRRLVYAFALWKQRRPQEAWDLLEKVDDSKRDLVPAALLRAAVLADMERRDDAANALKSFDASKALPEETNLATMVASKVRADARVSRVN
jgi:Flp pilus assembly protein TadD